MAITQDIYGNYFSGSELEGESLAQRTIDIKSILTLNGLSYSSYLDKFISFIPNGDSLSGPVDNLSTLPTNTTPIPNQSRISLMIDGVNTSSSIPAFFLLNSSNSNTEITVYPSPPATTTYTNWSTLFSGTDNNNWATLTNKSINLFSFVDSNNYLFISAGVLNNVITDNNPYPEAVYGMYTGKLSGVKYASFNGISLNSSIARGFLQGGEIDSNTASANYQHLVSSGLPGVGSDFGLRNSTNGYMVGMVPNLVKVKSTQALIVGQLPWDLNNITDNNNNILGSLEDRFMVVGRLDSTTLGDDLGDYLIMRVKKL